MKIPEFQSIIREVISEVKKETKKPAKKPVEKEEKLPKSSGKLMDLKKEYKALSAMKEQLQSYTLNEETMNSIEPQFSHMQKFVTELNRIKENTSLLSTNIDQKLQELKNKIASEKSKIREMIGLSTEKPQLEELDEAKKAKKPKPKVVATPKKVVKTKKGK